jgi:uncharacterized protein (DUF488 family)
MTKPLRIYTIGHSNCDLQTILDLLAIYMVKVLVDVRSVPYSRHAFQFNQKRIAQPLWEAGVRYEYLGDKLGGRPNDPACYKSGVVPTDWKNLLFEVDYPAVMKSDFFQEGISQLIGFAEADTVAVMCAEEDPSNCHRHHLIGKYLASKGVEVLHIRGDGTLQLDSQLSDQPGKKKSPSH